MSKPTPTPKKPTETEVIQPKSVQKMLLRYAIGLFALAGLFLGYQYLQNQGQDIDIPATVDTAGLVAAVEYLDNGSRVVVVGDDGTIRQAPGHTEGRTDRDPSWRPDGHRLFFISNRDEDVFQVFRWNLGSNRVERRSVGSRGKNLLQFGPPPATDRNEFALTTAGGKVLQFDPKTGDTIQVLPPVLDPTASEEGGSGVGQFDGVYDRLGESFREAKWTASKQFVVGVMRREDGSEVLVAQNLAMVIKGRAAATQPQRPPVPLAQGKRVDFDVHPTKDEVIFSTRDFQWPEGFPIPEEFRKGATVTRPFQHFVGIADLTKGPAEQIAPVLAVPEGGPAFGSLRVSPDGSTVLAVAGEWTDSGTLKPTALIVFPMQSSQQTPVTEVVRASIYEPAWHPNSRTIAFVRADSAGKRSVFTINRDGTSERNLTAGKGNFGHPVFSPQSK